MQDPALIGEELLGLDKYWQPHEKHAPRTSIPRSANPTHAGTHRSG